MSNGELIVGTRAIAKHMGIRNHVKVWRWIERGFLPAVQVPSGEWATTQSMIDSMMAAHYNAYMEKRPERLAKRAANRETRERNRELATFDATIIRA